MFYLTQFMNECVYKINNPGCYVISEKDADSLTIYDILSDKPADPLGIARCFGGDVKIVSFAFIPEDCSDLEKYLYKEEDTTFFILGDQIISDLPEIMSFPALIHA